MDKTTRPRKVYVASSWRNNLQNGVVHALRASGHEVYDFKNPIPNTGFHWSDVSMPSYDANGTGMVPFAEYVNGINHPRAIQGFDSDFNAMKWADTCVLVLPSGRSAHIETGWMVGQGKRTAILMAGENDDDWVTPDLTYRMADYITDSLFDLLGWFGVQEEIPLTGWSRDS